MQTFEKEITGSNHHYFLNPADKEKTRLRTDCGPPKRTWNGKFYRYNDWRIDGWL